MDDHVRVAKRFTNRFWIRHVGGHRVEAVALRLLTKSLRIAATENDVDAIFFREPCDQVAGITIGSVNENLACHNWVLLLLIHAAS